MFILSATPPSTTKDKPGGKYTELVLKLREEKKMKDAPVLLRNMPRRESIKDLLESATWYANIRGLEGAPFVSLIETAQDTDVAIFREEYLKIANKLSLENKFEVLLKCGFLYIYDGRFEDLFLGDEILSNVIGLNDDNFNKILTLIKSKHTYSLYVVEEIRRLDMIKENKHYIRMLEKIKLEYESKYEKYGESYARIYEEMIDKCNRSIAHVKKLKK